MAYGVINQASGKDLFGINLRTTELEVMLQLNVVVSVPLVLCDYGDSWTNVDPRIWLKCTLKFP